MSAVYKADANKCSIGAENLCINLVEHFPADIIITVAACSGKAGVGDLIVLKCLHYLNRIGLRDPVNSLKLRHYLFFCLTCELKNLRLHFTNFHIIAPLRFA